jgi:hypothetical protein
VQAIYSLYEQREAAGGGHRAHLGASVIGHACERYLWLHFRWAGRERFDGRMLRLFEAGHQFEPRAVAELRAIGVQVHEVDETGQQYRVSAHGGHFGGSLDGAVRGLPEAPRTWHVVEFKTHGDKSFAELTAKGVRASKPMHWAQMQVYMGLTGMQRALYLAENKNTSALYQERIEFDPAEFAKLSERAARIIAAAEPPPRINDDPAWYVCKMCTFHGMCHGTEAPEVNCRTCAHSTPRTDTHGGMWSCEHNGIPIGDQKQREGCAGHRYIPLLLERIGTKGAVSTEPDGNAAVQYIGPDGMPFVNGAPPAFSSREIAAAKHKAMLGDPQVRQIKTAWPAAEVVA